MAVIGIARQRLAADNELPAGGSGVGHRNRCLDAELIFGACLIPLTPRPSEAEYETLPLTQMFPLKVEDVLHQRNLSGVHHVKLRVTLDVFKTVDAAAALLIGSADELAGTVDVLDADGGDRLGEFYVDVLNYNSGPLGMVIRGAGVREKLATTFANQIAEQLMGGKQKAKSSCEFSKPPC